MDHHGIEYTVVQTIDPIGWKWSRCDSKRKPEANVLKSVSQ
jgi:hypothetical protein